MPDLDLNDIPIEDLRDAWLNLAANGTPPASEIAGRVLPAWSVKLDAWLDRLTTVYLRDYCRRNSHFKLAVAPYGGGKTHFLLALSARATAENWATSYLQCKAGVTISDWFGLYEQIARSITLPTGRKGIKAIAQAALEVMQNKATDKPDADAVIDMLIEAVAEEEWPNPSFGRVMAALLTHLRDTRTNPEIGDAAHRWLQGQPETLTAQERQRLHLQRVVGANRASHGRELLYSLVRFLPKTGCHGLALLLDEMDTILNAKGAALERIFVSMRVMLDAPDSRMDRIPLFGIFAAVPDITELIRQRGAGFLQSRLQVIIPFDQGDDNAPLLDLSQVGGQNEVLRAIGEKLLELGIKVHNWSFDRDLQRRNLQRLADVTANRILEVNARRLFVKAWCSLLGEQGRAGQREYAADVLADRIQGVYQAFRQADEAANANDIG